MTLEEEIVVLRAEVANLKEQVSRLLAANAQLQAQVDRLHSDPPLSFVKPSTPKPKNQAAKQPRRKRPKDQNGSRKRDIPTRTAEYRLEECPDCHYPLRHPTLAKRRQVVELPPPQPVEVTEHQLFRSWCARCSKWHYASVDLSGQVVGHSRIGVRIASLIAYLSTCMRMSVRLIREYLYTIHSLTLSTGEIAELLHRVAESQPLEQATKAIKERIRHSRVVHADETVWREEGQNGYVWSFSTPQGERLYEYNRSRAGEIPKGILGFGSEFKGVLCSDFYCGYNAYSGEHQRCWTHLLRDVHTLKEEHSDDVQVMEWAKGVRAMYDAANRLLLPDELGLGLGLGLGPPTEDELGLGLGPPTDEEAIEHPHKHWQRQRAYEQLVEQAARLGQQYAEAKQHRSHPCHTLCKRLLRHQDELFQFVLVPELSSSNNLAERSVRPVVVSRKVSGGTQSPRGSQTRMTLASLLGTWRAKGLNPFDQCLALLGQP